MTTTCAQEDGSGSTFPCRWDAQTQGNGQGTSFTMPNADSWLYDDGTLVCGEGTWANDAVTECVPIAEVGTVESLPVTGTIAEVGATDVKAHVALASTGVDPYGAAMATGLVIIGALLVAIRRMCH